MIGALVHACVGMSKGVYGNSAQPRTFPTLNAFFFSTSFRLKIGDLSTTSRYENVQETLEFAVKTLVLPVKFPINQSFDIPVVL